MSSIPVFAESRHVCSKPPLLHQLVCPVLSLKEVRRQQSWGRARGSQRFCSGPFFMLGCWEWLQPVLKSRSQCPNTEKALAPHSSPPAWKIPWTEEPGGLQSMGSRRVGHDWATSLSLFTFLHWRRKWQPTPVFLPGESQGWGSLVGCRLCGHTGSDTTEVT